MYNYQDGLIFHPSFQQTFIEHLPVIGHKDNSGRSCPKTPNTCWRVCGNGCERAVDPGRGLIQSTEAFAQQEASGKCDGISETFAGIDAYHPHRSPHMLNPAHLHTSCL